MSTESKVIQVVAQTLELSQDEVSTSDRFIEDLGANSLDIVNLIWRIEEAFSLPETPESVLEEIETVGDLVGLVAKTRSDEAFEASEVADLVIASDHAGVEFKAMLADWLREQGKTVVDLGPAEAQSVDYPDFAELLANKVAGGHADKGILICGSGIGMSIAANKVPDVRAALVTDPLMASLSRQHNNANVLCLGARIIGEELAKACVDAFLTTDFDPGDDGRHQRRVGRIAEIARQSCK
ncbi:ribose 5-phosphate isomerase B [Persicimonas caeni]|uniref:Acyl carrier protein n=1 Tax=Persicimonas caeni TaxID=2292766 RepID=A0A4Y6Q1A8_PERCE|nr:ribose 5-phosphate isomerase B [Persicimonas caeni]QDG53765.1 ribose 5-phosphate isomerase B [Persicimonas caeni]QED34986.1 ribose 5-phosphate isomerase B [Persicimonas caeni]